MPFLILVSGTLRSTVGGIRAAWQGYFTTLGEDGRIDKRTVWKKKETAAWACSDITY
jgi:hypothetical protein